MTNCLLSAFLLVNNPLPNTGHYYTKPNRLPACDPHRLFVSLGKIHSAQPQVLPVRTTTNSGGDFLLHHQRAHCSPESLAPYGEKLCQTKNHTSFQKFSTHQGTSWQSPSRFRPPAQSQPTQARRSKRKHKSRKNTPIQQRQTQKSSNGPKNHPKSKFLDVRVEYNQKRPQQYVTPEPSYPTTANPNYIIAEA